VLSFTAVLVLVIVPLYTVLLLVASRRVGSATGARDFLNGGGEFSAWQVFTLVSALWCSSIFVVEMETGYLFGVSALWFGFSTALMALVSGYLVPTFRRLGYLTSSGVIGVRFGQLGRVLSGLVIGLTFPIFAMSNVLGAAGFLHRVAGWPLALTLVVAVAVILGYVCVGGMRALARAQSINLLVMTVGLVGALVWAVRAVPISQLGATVPPRLLTVGGAGAGLILTWVFAALLNVVNAQAEFQILTAARDARSARRGLHASVLFTAVFTIGSVAIGIAARSLARPHELGVAAIPGLFDRAPSMLLALVALAVWASALSWSSPLMLSGAASLGVDVLQPLLRRARRPSARNVAFYVRIALPVQALLIVGFAVLRPADLAWWRIFGQTVRTGALFAVTLAVLALPRVGRREAVASIVGGAAGGLGWNVLTRFSADRFAWGVNPMWVGASVGLLILAAGVLRGQPARPAVLLGDAWPAVLLTVAGVDLLLLGWQPGPARQLGLTGPGILLAAGCLLMLRWYTDRAPQHVDLPASVAERIGE